MDCALFLVSNLDNETLKRRIYNIVCETVEDKVTSYEGFSRLSCKYFVLDIETEDIISIDFLREEYGMNINAEIGIQLFGKSFEEGLEVLFKIFGNILMDFNPDMVFVENGTDQLFRKENATVIINTKLDQFQKKYLSSKIINLLRFPYIFQELSN
ncbi:hypothetical protein [Aneurinibacillus aneurinilyticus]|uniref:Uncharacterized protein n=1 Tax=Aneurinibacillus aneurinilyticus ATCC 12856 TaxID=649747 RepID=U1X4G0_ANEAE|nr:hypothetical protein [Aneurinibacillus aneurinilyticus]ERI09428.1 hypothetical protein HMPREF0083_02474 [Aneurinibacillus aneurinilyticus ATCC 12856]MED0706053.1 hypothetical protein [Aneurinibacillus aneurinilyticus]MED0726392.1 hypothetical protein [Aneurinibacillus aneurinilyticus]MED0735183.1 hypothetical protein [Aneurinibacillus aneurinilyticus]MED0743540.1 hypothetical protein [Aneurinibacillus aneurinilyticus]